MTTFAIGKPRAATKPMAWYNSIDKMAESVKTIAGFHALIDARGRAAYGRGESLSEFIVLGTWLLDSCGNAMKASGMSPGKALREKGVVVPHVSSKDEFFSMAKNVLGDDCPSSFGMESDIPEPQLLCPECHKPWTIEDCDDVVVKHETTTLSLADHVGLTLGEVKSLFEGRTDAVYRIQLDMPIRNDAHIDNAPDPEYPTLSKNKHGWLRDAALKTVFGSVDAYIVKPGDETMMNTWTYRHKACSRSRVDQDERDHFRKVFADAGVEVLEWQDVPNEYCRCHICATWLTAKTAFGMFKVGWRKRVINIEFDNVIDLSALFADQDVTKGTNYIHAWGWEKATEYIRKIKERALGLQEDKQ